MNRLFNGAPPWPEDEAVLHGIHTNVNFLDGPKLLADGRRSLYNAFLKPSNFFSASLDFGPVRSRSKFSQIVTSQINRVMKDSLPYFETIRSKIASTVLNGIGPVHWPDMYCWKNRALGLDDLLIPSNTLLSMENLTYFAIFRRYTAPELADKINRKNVDPAWNIPLAKAAIKWAMMQTQGDGLTAYSTEVLSPEKIEEKLFADGLYYGTDAAPTIDTWDFYFLSDAGGKTGWRRRMILDTPADNMVGGEMPKKNLIGGDHGEWLYDTGDKVYAPELSQILHFQFGDLSAVAPFKYHTVRSLGWLIYAVCHLQNRLRCRVNDATFENLLNYFRVSNPDDNARLTKIDLHNYGVVPEGVQFVPQNERWQINQGLVAGTMSDNRSMLNEAASQYREGRDNQSGKEKTATEIMAEVNSANALVGSMLLLAYTYEKANYREIVRRFFQPNSGDPEVAEFRLNVLKRGVPEKLLDLCYWRIEPEKVLGSGNKMLQTAMADKLMAVRPLLDPDSQRDVIRLYAAANSDDAELASRLVPDKPILVTESTHDAQLMIGSIMAGVTVAPRGGQEPQQTTAALLAGMAEIMKAILASGIAPTPPQLAGLANLATTIENYNGLIAQDDALADLSKQNAQELAQMVQILKKWVGEVQQAQPQPGANGNGAGDEQAMTQAKIQGIVKMADTKVGITKTNAAIKQQQRDEQFQQKQLHAEEQHTANLRKTLKETDVGIAVTDAKTAAEIRNTTRKAKAKPETQNA